MMLDHEYDVPLKNKFSLRPFDSIGGSRLENKNKRV